MPKLRLVGLTVSFGAPVPFPLRFTAKELCCVASLLIVSVPSAVPVAVGANSTFSFNVWPGFSLAGNVAPDIVKPAPLAVAELIVTGSVPLEVNIAVWVAEEPISTLPKLRLIGLIDSCGALAATPVLARLTTAVAFVEELLLIVSAPVAAPVVIGAACTLSVTVFCGLSVRGKLAPLTVNPSPLTFAELIVTAAVPLDVSVTGSVAFAPTVTLPKFRLAGFTVSVAVPVGAAAPVPVREACASG